MDTQAKKGSPSKDFTAWSNPIQMCLEAWCESVEWLVSLIWEIGFLAKMKVSTYKNNKIKLLTYVKSYFIELKWFTREYYLVQVSIINLPSSWWARWPNKDGWSGHHLPSHREHSATVHFPKYDDRFTLTNDNNLIANDSILRQQSQHDSKRSCATKFHPSAVNINTSHSAIRG